VILDVDYVLLHGGEATGELLGGDEFWSLMSMVIYGEIKQARALGDAPVSGGGG
jgi:hypothetical protein